jgi:hypothetical protein
MVQKLLVEKHTIIYRRTRWYNKPVFPLTIMEMQSKFEQAYICFNSVFALCIIHSFSVKLLLIDLTNSLLQSWWIYSYCDMSTLCWITQRSVAR